MTLLTSRFGALLAAPLMILTLAACGSTSTDSADAVTACVEGGTSEAAKAISKEKKEAYCKCLMPKLSDAGFKDVDAADKAIEDKDAKAIAAVTACASNLVRGY